MDDLISRQWLMECVNEGWIKFDTEKDKNRFIHLVRDIAPSVQPEPNTGHWVSQKGGGCCCSECGRYALDEVDGSFIHVAFKSNFCPHCGAYMKGGATT